MSSRQPFPARFRQRIAIAFVAVAGLSAGALALGAGVTVYSYRTTTFLERAREQVRDDVRLIAAGAAPVVVASRLAGTEEPGDPAVVVVTDGQEVASFETIGLDDVPPEVRRGALGEHGSLAEARTELRSGTALVIGTVDPDSRAEAYFFFPREELERSIRELQVTLGVGWVLVVAVAGIAGTLVARRALRPVREAADAARSVAEGLLDTRLPVGSSDEFGEWAAAFNEMVAALEHKIGALADARDREQRFAADVAHELRTPIGSILTASSHLESRNGAIPDDVREVNDIVMAAARRLDRLTSELLELHRLETGHEQLQIEEVDLVTAVGYSVRSHGWTSVVDTVAAGSVVVSTDRRRLDRIIVNLINNGLHHGGGRVTVDIGRDDAAARIAVRDDGPGIPPDALPHLFDRHYKASTHRSGDTALGSGLGLSIALESAQSLGGRLDVASDRAHGTTFTLWLPDRPPSAGPAAP